MPPFHLLRILRYKGCITRCCSPFRHVKPGNQVLSGPPRDSATALNRGRSEFPSHLATRRHSVTFQSGIPGWKGSPQMARYSSYSFLTEAQDRMRPLCLDEVLGRVRCRMGTSDIALPVDVVVCVSISTHALMRSALTPYRRNSSGGETLRR